MAPPRDARCGGTQLPLAAIATLVLITAPAAVHACNQGEYASSSGSCVKCPAGRYGVLPSWTKVIDVKGGSGCPGGWSHSGNFGGICRRWFGGAGCASTIANVGGATYTEVRGKVLGYQYASNDGIRNQGIDHHYLDGVSITTQSPRTHIWSYINGYSDNRRGRCPCSGGWGTPSFVSSDYYCESGNHGDGWSRTWYNDLLWDGATCNQEQECCNPNNSPAEGLPWFFKRLDQPTNRNIEIRLCCDQGNSDEDIGVRDMELYIRKNTAGATDACAECPAGKYGSSTGLTSDACTGALARLPPLSRLSRLPCPWCGACHRPLRLAYRP